MKNIYLFFSLFMGLIALPGYAIETTSPESSDGGLAVILFLGFIALIIIGQLIPGIKLFFSLLKDLFKKHPSKIKPINHK